MKKYLLSLGLIAAFAGYAFYQNSGDMTVVSDNTQSAHAGTSAPVAADTPPATSAPIATAQPSTHSSAPTTAQTQPATKPQGQYNDGTYTGSVADAYYGNIQVRATVSGGKLTNVQFLQYPNDRSTSREINGQAMPILKSEAIAAQSANVDIVSGATDSSQAFVESLGSALAQAKA